MGERTAKGALDSANSELERLRRDKQRGQALIDEHTQYLLETGTSRLEGHK